MARLSIDLVPELHRVIKGEASLRGMSIRTFVMDAIHEQILKTHKPSTSDPHECPLCKIYKPRGFNKRTEKALKESTKKIKEGKRKPYHSTHDLFHALKIK